MTTPGEPIAVIGTGCRFPGGSSDPSKLWELLSKPRDVQRKIDRFKAENFFHADGHRHGTSNVRHAYLFTEDPRAFDAQFFNISAGEAEAIDPQQRVLLEAVYESIDSAGLSIEALRGSSTAVYVGVMCDDYTDIVYHDYENIPTYAATGSARSILSNRISYFFDWHGPSMTIDTACSSSLIAVHQGVQALRSGESKVAVAGGANLIFGPKMFVAESNLSMLSPTGRSQMWDSNANGYARGEGVAAIVMKTLKQAIADGDNIECVIRETGINQDGRTMGITMPSSSAQCALIQDTYARAGLDLSNPRDRPQYFEAHGTGTKAGDPQEARAIHSAFFGGEVSRNITNTLHVGSIKTIIGHTEGTAGLAGLIKASLAIQNKTIPANLLFNNLNPDIEPYYGPIKIPTKALAWPELAPGVRRRASVNSFGFGGANAHAIIENYDDIRAEQKGVPADSTVVPFVFSASTEKTLERQLQTYLNFFKTNGKVDLRDVALSLTRRSAHVIRCAISASSSQKLQEKIQATIDAKADGKNLGTRASVKEPQLLGIFTGQGAQWATMGGKLFTQFPSVRKTFKELQESLDSLPESDRPAWNLIKELTAEGKSSRIGQGAFSQPLCTAVQVALIDLLTESGVRFSAVVGHSSGEIGACYAAGFINRSDAIRIAYYRGLYAKYATGPNGEKGAMMAVGTSLEDAQELCSLPTFEGRLAVAASNSSASVTISGNADAMDEAAFILEDESKFARKLKVDTAYHSHHMKPCAKYYISALDRCKIQISQPEAGAPAWYSSVHGGKMMTMEDEEPLTSKYWMDNMLQAVLFSQALEAAVKDNQELNLAMEVGPHPALKGPASLTIEETLKHDIPYTGTLKRGSDDVEAVADCLGFIWENTVPQTIDFKAFDYLSTGMAESKVLKNLPTYAWDHDKNYWGESRTSRAFRQRTDAHHELLGARLGEDTDGDISWRNHLKPNDSTWLRGHEIQGQKLFPAAGYAAIAIEASRAITPNKTVRLIELEELRIHQALAFIDEVAGVEVVIKLGNIKRTNEAGYDSATARYECFACLNKEAGNFTLMTSATVKVVYGEPAETTLPQRVISKQKMSDVDVDEFYSSLVNVGYNYQGIFQGISSLKRAKDISCGTIMSNTEEVLDQPYFFHPAPLDVAFQSVFAAIGSPGDGMLWTIHVPTVIRRISVNTSGLPANGGLGVELEFDAFLNQNGVGGVSGDVLIYGADRSTTVVQIEGLHVTPLSAATAINDKTMFQHDVWDVGTPDLESAMQNEDAQRSSSDTATAIERCCLFYLKQLLELVTEDDRDRCDWHQARILEWAEHVVELVRSDHHPILRKAWLQDTEPVSQELGLDSELGREMALIHDIGQKLLPFIRGNISTEELYTDLDIVEHFHKNSYGVNEYVGYLGMLIKQIAHRHQNLTVLQVGDRLDTTKKLLTTLDNNFSYYTFTDMSADFFEEATEALQTRDNRFFFKTLDIEVDLSSQGFKEHSFDLIIAVNTLHTANNLDDALQNVRKLLRPGGYLALLETTNTALLRTNFIMSGLSQYWTIEDSRRSLSPLVDHRSWDEALCDAGFAGIDSATIDSEFSQIPFSVMVSQAIDDQVMLMRQPLLADSDSIPIDNLLIIGGAKLSTARLIKQVLKTLKSNIKNVTVIESLQKLTSEQIPDQATTLCLAELDQAYFNPFTEQKLQILQKLVEKSRQMLWVVQGAAGEQPYSNMIIGVARCLVGEAPHLRWQTMDFDIGDRLDHEIICEELLRLRVHAKWRHMTGPKPLWPMETEVRVTKGGVLVPRCSDYPGPNARYNSAKRIIRKEVALPERAVGIVRHGANGFEVQEQLSSTPFVTDSSNLSLITINVESSTWYAFKLADAGYFYLVVGTVAGTSSKVLAFSDHQLSTITVPAAWSINLSPNRTDNNEALSTLANSLLAHLMVHNLKTGQSILVHEADERLSEQLRAQAAERQVTLYLTSCDETRTDCRYLHLSASGRALQDVLPSSASSFVDLSRANKDRAVVKRVGEMLPRSCIPSSISSLLTASGYAMPGHHDERISTVLHYLGNAISKTEIMDLHPNDHLTLKEVPAASENQSVRTVVQWNATPTVPVRVVPAEENFRMRSDRTYFMVGLTGSLGLSLVRFMVEHGAKHFALTSRNPNIDETWMAQMTEKGADVRAYAMDVTDKRSVEATVQKIRQEMPPIVGVANGAMILIDCLLQNHTHEKFSTTLKAKVDGTRYLDEIFTEKDLDFFMAFSSLAFTSGNFGQSSYAAANAFMTSVVQGRRARGLAGCVMHLSGIYGIGYVERTDRKIMSHLEKYGMFNISEWDFHQFFAEAVAAGRPESGLSPDVASNLTTSDPEKDEHVPAWVDCPRYGHFRFVRQEIDDDTSEASSAANVRPLLAVATTEKAIYDILMEGLKATLVKQLHLPSADQISPDQVVVELGVDSLTAVDLRTWFTKELDIDMPVLKILGGATLAEVIADAVKRLPAGLTPKFKGEGGQAAPAAATTAEGDKPAATEGSEQQEGEASADQSESTNSTADGEADVGKVRIALDRKDSAESDTSAGTDSSSATGDGKSSATSVSTPDIESAEKTEMIGIDDQEEVLSAIDNAELELPPFARPKEGRMAFEKIVKMSYAATRFWFLDQFLSDPSTFNLMMVVRFSGVIDVSKLEETIISIGQRHEAFRTAFFADAENLNQPSQGILPVSKFRLVYDNTKTNDEFKTMIPELQQEPFDLETGLVARANLFSFQDGSHALALRFHHIVFDGFSFNILLSDLNKTYFGEKLPKIEMQYSEYALHERDLLETGKMEKSIQYWKDQYTDFPDPLPLFPGAQVTVRQPLHHYDYIEVKQTLDSRTMLRIREQSKRMKATTFNYFLATFKTFLFRFLDTKDVVIGMADAHRGEPGILNTIGFFLNLLPLRFKYDENQTFGDAVTEARTTAQDALANADVPFDILLERLNAPRSASYNPLFQAFVDYRQYSGDATTVLSNKSVAETFVGRTAYDLVLDVNDIANGELNISMRGQKYLYSETTMHLLMDSFVRLLRAFSTARRVAPSQVPLYETRDIKNALALGRGSYADREWPETISHRIDDISKQYGDDVALRDPQTQLTYAQMMQKVDQITDSLVQAGVGESYHVGVLQKPTVDWMCSLLGIWRAGATYVPLDLRNGIPRLQVIVDNAKLDAVLYHDHTSEELTQMEFNETNKINISALTTSATDLRKENQATATGKAAIIYTSGSTGTPKGIVLQHSGICSEMEGYSRMWNIGRQVVLQQSAYSFDFSLDQMLSALSNGGTLFVASSAMREDPSAIAKAVKSEGITYTKATPSEYSAWIEHGLEVLSQATSWKMAFGGGEAITKALMKDFKLLNLSDLHLLNSYGPAEATISCVKADLDYRTLADGEEEIAPAGIPLPNYSLQIVDRNLQPLPLGTSGEIVIGGAGISKGYLGDDEMTRAKFIEDTQATARFRKQGWTRLYRSGDKGYIRADGQLYILGRMEGDTQIKLRGIRIELADIESTILKTAGDAVVQAVVSVRGDPQFLVAHVKFATEMSIEAQRARASEILATLPLPTFMKPSIIVPVDSFPLNSHRKTDRRAIAELTLPKFQDSDEELSETQITLRNIWRSIVSEDLGEALQIGKDTDFFQAGGNSLLLVKLQAVILQKLNVSLPIVKLFTFSSLEAMAQVIESADTVNAIDWAAETAVSADALLHAQSIASMKIEKPAGKVVLITGASGYLGRRLLRTLAARDDVAKIHAVAVRNAESLQEESTKLVIHRGDLAEPRLGLSEDIFSTLAAEVDVIVHSGANRAFWDQYHLLRNVNFSSTKQLAAMANARKIPIHLLSSGGVLDFIEDTSLRQSTQSVRSYQPPVNGLQGYISSKWASEVFLENLHEQFEIPVQIHRVTPADTQIASSIPPELLEELGNIAVELKSLPIGTSNWEGTFDLLEADPLAAKIVSSALNSTTATAAGMDIIHYPGSIRLDLKALMGQMDDYKDVTEDFERVLPHIWIGKAKKMGFNYHVASNDLMLGGGLNLRR